MAAATCSGTSLVLNSLKQTTRASLRASPSSTRLKSVRFFSSPLKAFNTQVRHAAVGVKAIATAPPVYKTLKPLGDRVLVKIEAPEEKSQGGIILPTSSQTKPQRGEVVEVGEGKKVGDKKFPPCVTAGNTIVYSKYAGTEIQFNDADHILLKEDDIIGLLASEEIKDLKPLNDRVLIKVAEAEEKTSGGVLLTDTVKEKPVIGKVIAVGPGSYNEDGSRKALEVSVGDTVLYSKFAGNDFKGKGEDHVVLRVSDVLAILS